MGRALGHALAESPKPRSVPSHRPRSRGWSSGLGWAELPFGPGSTRNRRARRVWLGELRFALSPHQFETVTRGGTQPLHPLHALSHLPTDSDATLHAGALGSSEQQESPQIKPWSRRLQLGCNGPLQGRPSGPRPAAKDTRLQQAPASPAASGVPRCLPRAKGFCHL